MRTVSVWFVRVLAVCLPLLLFSTRCYAQWEADSYTSNWTDGTTIYTSVVTEGEVLPGFVEFSHTYYAYNTIGDVGGWAQAGPSPVWTSVQNDQQIDGSDGSEYAFVDEEDVECNVVGEVYNAINEAFLSIHRTTYKYASPIDGGCIYNVFCGNTPHICGDDSTTVEGPCPPPGQPYFITVWLKVRVASFSTCFPGPQAVFSATPLACN